MKVLYIEFLRGFQTKTIENHVTIIKLDNHVSMYHLTGKKKNHINYLNPM